MKIEDLEIVAGGQTLAATRVLAGNGAPPSVISFHGTGATTHRSRIRYILDDLASRDISSACFDFSGHGESSGSVEDATLASRMSEALEAATILCPPSPRTIIGTSMGAYLAASLSPQLRPHSLILFAPAAYPQDQVGDRERALTDFQPSADDSPAFEALQQFDGKLLIVVGQDDPTITREIVDRYVRSAPAAQSKVIRLQCGHMVHPWLGEHDDARRAVLAEIAAAIS
jgi:pimeloyl-ACP methyl ester carboxylesterase